MIGPYDFHDITELRLELENKIGINVLLCLYRFTWISWNWIYYLTKIWLRNGNVFVWRERSRWVAHGRITHASLLQTRPREMEKKNRIPIHFRGKEWIFEKNKWNLGKNKTYFIGPYNKIFSINVSPLLVPLYLYSDTGMSNQKA